MFIKITHFLEVLIAWITKDRRNMIIVLAGFLVSGLSFFIFMEYALPKLAAVAFFCWLFFNEPIERYITRVNQMPVPPLTLANNQVCWEITQFFFDVLSSNRDVIAGFCQPPRTVSEIYDPLSYRVAYNAVPMLRLRLLRKRELTVEELEFLKMILQSFVNARVLDGHLTGYPWAVAYNLVTPILKIISVEMSGIYVSVGIVLTNDEMGVRAAYISDRPPLPATVDDTDPLV